MKNTTEMRAAMSAGLTHLLESLKLTRANFPGKTDAGILGALADRFAKQGSVNASLTTLKLANTARDLEAA